jgi:hypothetical protein
MLATAVMLAMPVLSALSDVKLTSVLNLLKFASGARSTIQGAPASADPSATPSVSPRPVPPVSRSTASSSKWRAKRNEDSRRPNELRRTQSADLPLSTVGALAAEWLADKRATGS